MISSTKQINVFLSLLFLFFATNGSTQIYINEILASNASVNEDPDFQENADWIELYNFNNEALDLSGWYLSDDLSNPIKWQIPSGVQILSNDFLIFWADNQDTGTHTNFKLSKNGEAIGLFDPAGNLVDGFEFGEQSSDISYGRLVDGSEEFGYFQFPTPQASNDTGGHDGLTFYEVQFSPKGGFYPAPKLVSLNTIDGVIRFTLDGSEPDENSELYDNPILVAATQVIRARVFKTDHLPGKLSTHTYFIEEDFEERNLPVISISTHPDNFWGADTGLYAQDFKPLWEHPINIELFENDGDNRAAFSEQAGIKINGNNSWQLPQKMMGIYFNNDYDKSNLEYPLFLERDRMKYDNFSLRASGTDQSYTFFRDGLIQHLTHGNMDLETQGFKPASVYVNGAYLGLYNLRSRLDEQFVEHYFNLSEGEYDIIDNNGIVEEGDTLAFYELFVMLNQDLSVQSNFDALGQILDIPNLTDYFITEIWASNGSWGHNIKWWKPKATDTKWRFLLKDLDRGFFGTYSSGFINYTLEGISPSSYEWARSILRQLFKNEAYRVLFAQRFADHLVTTFHPDRVSPKVAEMRGRIANEMPYQIERWLGSESNLGDAIPNIQHWEDQVNRLNFFTEFRYTHLWKELQTFFGLSSVSAISLVSQPANSGDVYFNDLQVPEDNWTSFYFDDTPFLVEAKPKIGQQFIGWAFGTFEEAISKQSQWKYLDDGSDLGTIWKEEDFDDSNWDEAQAQFGYGDADEITVLNFGNDEDQKFITSYFRKKFTIDDLSDYTGQLIVNLLIDDGAVLYLNGEEIRRVNMPVGTIFANSLALKSINAVQEFDYNQLTINSNLLKIGENTLAVEIHQESPSSSDVSFDMDLILVKRNANNLFSTEEVFEFSLSQDSVLIATFIPDNICTIPQVISSDLTLTTACSPYYAIGTTSVLPNVTLEVEAGVEIYMPENASLIINGDLQINGTEDSPVKIMPSPENSLEQWGNLHFNQSTAISNLNHLEINGASKGFHPLRENAAISAFYATLNLRNIKFENTHEQLIRGQYSHLHLQDSYFEFEKTGTMFHFEHGTALIENCELKGKSEETCTGILLEAITDATIRGNKIFDFLGKDSKGIIIAKEAQNVLIAENFIHNCQDKGLLLKTQASAVIQNNTFVNCKDAIAVKSLAMATVDQNTFYNNDVAINSFEKNAGEGGGNAMVKNCLLSNSSKSPIYSDEHSSIDISLSLSDTDSIPNNLFANPLFVNPTEFDFHLLPNSPAINVGQNSAGQITDLGTAFHEFNAPSDILISAIHYHPPFQEEAEFLDIYNPRNEPIDLTAYQFTSGIEMTFPEGSIIPAFEKIRLVKNSIYFQDATEFILQWDAGSLSNEGEKIKLEDKNGITIDQVIYENQTPWPELANGSGKHLVLKSDDLDNHFAENWEAVGDIINGNNEILKENFVKISPNPNTNNFFMLQTDFPIKNISVFNTIGRSIKKIKGNGNMQEKIVTETWQSGIYFIKINEAIMKKIVIP